MALTFADTYNMIAYLTISDASEVFNQIIHFLNASLIKYALTVNDVTRLQALVDKKKVIITEATIRDALRLDDAESAASVTVDDVPTDVDEPSIPSPPPTTQPPLPSQDLPSTLQVQPSPSPSPIAQPPSPIAQPASPQQQLQPSRDAEISMDLLHTLLETCTSLTRIVKHLEVDISDDTVMDDVSKQERIIASMDTDKDVTLKDVADVADIAKEVAVDAEIEESVDVQGRQAESQAQIYQIDLEHADKVLSMQDDEIEPVELQEVVEVVTTAKLMTEVVIAASATITATTTLIPAATITFAPKPKSKDKGKGILVEEPKPLKKQAQRKEKEDNPVMRYKALKKKPQIEAQARKNMMIYLGNMIGFKMDYFKGMKYDDIRPIFKKYFNSNVAFLEKTKEQMEEEDIRALKIASESEAEKAGKKQKLDDEVEEIKRHLQIVPNDEDDVYTEATPLACKVPVVDYEIYTKNNKPYYRIIRVDGCPHLFLSFLSLLRNFDREDLEVLWQLIKERFSLSKPKNFSNDFLLTTLTYMFEKPDVQAQMILLVERRYPLTRFTLDQMLNNVRLEVEEESEVSLELLRFVRKQQQEGIRPE
nr:hypothetical protein [Tanacetum cinerariifolium]